MQFPKVLENGYFEAVAKKSVTMYSCDDEDYQFDCADDCIKTFELVEGDKYYSHEFVHIDADYILDGIGRKSFFEWMSDTLTDDLSEDSEIEYSDTPEAQDEWKLVVNAFNKWMDNHTNITRFMRCVGKTTEYTVTKEDAEQ